MILIIDNYDSFTYNLVQYFGELNSEVKTIRNDKINLKDIKKLNPDKIVISPGPGRPENAGISCQVIKEFSKDIPILGVCLGHQCIAYTFSGKIVHANKLMHGKTSLIYHSGQGIFKGVKNPFVANRYHSLIVDPNSLPICLEIIAYTKKNEIMGIRHKNFAIWGVQFHPESILTSEGKKILRNFLDIGG